MRFTMKCLCKVALFSVFLPLSCQVAQGSWSPLGVGLFFTDETQSPGIDDSVYGLNIGVFGSCLDEMKGLSVSSLATIADDMAGIVFSGIFNKTESAADGVWQVGGGANIIEDSGAGLQIAGLFNYAKDFTGVQIGAMNLNLNFTPVGGVPLVECYVHGAQLGGINCAEVLSGFQIGGVNGAKVLSGFQIGGRNNCAEVLSGLQLGGINRAREVCGVQIGLVNVAEESLRGVQIGALNFVRGSDIVFTPLLRVSF